MQELIDYRSTVFVFIDADKDNLIGNVYLA
jgi:hypothetical protein